MAAEKQPHTGHRARVRARFLREGLDAFEDHNALELLLFYAVPQRDTNELAHKLINAFGSLSAVFDAPVQSLMQVGGISENTAVLIKLIPAMYGKYARSKQNPDTLFLKSAEAAGAYFTSLFAGKSTEKAQTDSGKNRICDSGRRKNIDRKTPGKGIVGGAL